MKTRLVGCAVVFAILLVGIALMSGVDWSRIGTGENNGGGGEEQELARELARQFGDQPEVEFVCRFAVVGEAPCLPGEGAGSREVTVTFSSHELPTGVDPQEHARRIGVVASEVSSFVRHSDKTEVVFHEGDESASVVRRYSFSAGELSTGGKLDVLPEERNRP